MQPAQHLMIMLAGQQGLDQQQMGLQQIRIELERMPLAGDAVGSAAQRQQGEAEIGMVDRDLIVLDDGLRDQVDRLCVLSGLVADQAEQVQPPSLTPLVAAMESTGLVVRLPDPQDRRICRVELTAEGRRALERIRRAKNAYLGQRLASLDGAERDRARDLTELLESLVSE